MLPLAKRDSKHHVSRHKLKCVEQHITKNIEYCQYVMKTRQFDLKDSEQNSAKVKVIHVYKRVRYISTTTG